MSGLGWSSGRRGWWEAEGASYRYRAVQAQSNRWDLVIFEGDGGVAAEVGYPVTLGDCKYYAEQLEAGRYRIEAGNLVRGELRS